MKVAIFGYSGHAYVVLDILKSIGVEIIGYYDNQVKDPNPFKLRYLGCEKRDVDSLGLIEASAKYIIGIGDNHLRSNIDEYLSQRSLDTVSAVARTASVSSSAEIRDGVVVGPGAVVNALAFIGRCSIVNSNATVEHEAHVGEYAHIAPGAVLAGNVKVGRFAFIGANSTIKQNVCIGANATIGAGSVVLQDVADNEVWVGSPARRIRHDTKNIDYR